MYCYVWSFEVRAEFLDEFQSAYGPEGDWARFFRTDPAYVRTFLLADRNDPLRFVTLDFWASYEAWTAFRQRCAMQFDEMDKTFERFTVQETQMGSFNVSGESGRPFIPETIK